MARCEMEGCVVKATHLIRSPRPGEDTLKPGSLGKIISVRENIGRQLILVLWEAGFETQCFPDDIELLT